MRQTISTRISLAIALLVSVNVHAANKPTASSEWTFAVSGDSRNCGDFVMPVVASQVKAEGDAFYWHLGDFRAIYQLDQDLVSMLPAGTSLTLQQYQPIAWDDFLTREMAPFGNLPVFLGRGNHETIPPMTRDGYVVKFSTYLNRPEIVAQDAADGAAAAPQGSPWFHFVRNGVDFITLDNSTQDEFSNKQLTWLQGVLTRDRAPNSGVTTIIAGMHEALPHSTTFSHAMDDWPLGIATGEMVYHMFADAQTAGKHVYLLASHSHFYAPGIYDSPYWRQAGLVIPSVLIGAAGAHRYKLPDGVSPEAKTHIYGYLQATVHADGTVKFVLKEISEDQMNAGKWPNAPADAIHDCVVNNSD